MSAVPRLLRAPAIIAALLVVIGLAATALFLRTPQQSAGASQRSQPSLSPALAPPLKIVTEQAGLTAIAAADLRAAGLDPGLLPPDRWQLRQGEQPTPLLPVGQGDDLRLIFYAEPSDNLYSRRQVYWLEAAPEQGLRPAQRPIAVAQSANPVQEPTTVVTGVLRLAWQQTYKSQLVGMAAGLQEEAERDHWLGAPLFGGQELALPFVVADLASGPAALHLRLWANTTATDADPDHHVQVWLNGQLIAEQTHKGRGFWDIRADLPDGRLRLGENDLRLRAPGDTGARVEQDFPDWLRLTYPRRLAATSDQLEFTAPAGDFRLTGFSPGADLLLWDVSEPQAPVQLLGEASTVAAGSGNLIFGDPTGPAGLRRYVAAALAALPRPAAITRPLAGDLRSAPPSDYLAIGPSDLLPALQPLLDWRRRSGLTTLAVDAEAVYEQFDAGRRGPQALRNFLRFAAAQWPSPPRFLLLVGDGSYDPLGYAGPPLADRLPVCLVDTRFIGQTASDHCYADLDDDLLPELAVGRLPAQTPDQVVTLVDKIIAYEQAPAGADWLRNALLVAGPEPEFPAASAQIAAEILTPAGYAVQTLYLGEPAWSQPGEARSQFFRLLDSGIGLLNYAGHGSPRWWAGELLSNEDAADLPNSGRWPIVTAMTCLTGFFQHPSVESLAEALLWAPGGAIAAFAPSGEGTTAEQTPLALAFYGRVTQGTQEALGEAIMAAKRDLAKTGYWSEDIMRTFNLLGDPALRLRPLGDR